MLKLVATSEGGEKILRRMRILSDRVKDLMPAWDQVEKLTYKYQRRAFDTKGREPIQDFRLGKGYLPPWQPLKKATIKAKRREGYAKPSYPLIATGKLRSEATSNAVDKTPLTFYYSIDPVEVPYAIYHHSDEPRKVIPQRKIIRIPIIFARQIEKIIQKHLVSTGQFVRETVF